MTDEEKRKLVDQMSGCDELELAERVDVSVSSVRRWKAGTSFPRRVVAKRLHQVLKGVEGNGNPLASKACDRGSSP